jgi:hypothetical protein
MKRFRLPAAICLTLGLALASAAGASAATTVEVTSSLNPSTFGQKVVLTATVIDPSQPASQITGTMTFSDEEAWLGTAEVTNGKAKLADSAIDAGSDPITATFTPTGGGAEVASAPFPQVVNPADTTVTLVSSRPTASYGQAGSVTATVKSVTPASIKPTGSIEYFIDGEWFSTASLNTLGKAKLALAEIYPAFFPGTYAITAAYSGDQNFNPSTTSTPLAQTIVGSSSTPVSTISLDAKGRPVFGPSSFTLSSASPAGCNVTITNNTALGFSLLYGTPGSWKILPGGFIAAGASRGVGVSLEHFTGYFTVRGAANHITIKCA